MSVLTDLRDLVYNTISAKKTANAFYYANNFTLEKTWRPWKQLEDLFDAAEYPSGLVYVIGGRAGDMMSESRTNVCKRDYPVHIGFQKAITKPTSSADGTAEIDDYDSFVEELEETLRTEIDNQSGFLLSFSRLEPQRDPMGLPLSYLIMREVQLFEAYFTAFYVRALGENVATTTTT